MTSPPNLADPELSVPAFEQNHATFRSLNHQMWQIPLISMTLTGGLWFGVSKVEDLPLFQVALLFLATIGNAALFLVIQRLRYVMEQTLNWLETRSPANFVSAKGDRWYNEPLVVRRSFQGMLALACLTSLGLLVITCLQTDWSQAASPMIQTEVTDYYDNHAHDLADSYEGISAAAAHPRLQKILEERFSADTLDILDIGSGTGRDAAWLASLGHQITAVEPSNAMRQIARKAHQDRSVRWLADGLPDLSVVRGDKRAFDVIVLSAVWMHIAQEDRERAVSTIASLMKPNGVAYMTLRLGPADASRFIYEVSLDELAELADRSGLVVEPLDMRSDLLGRSAISWQTVLLYAQSKS